MKKNYFLYLLLTFFLFNAGKIGAQTFSGGDGSSGDPYLISTVDDLRELSVHVVVDSITFDGLHFKLMANLDLSADYDHTPIGTIEDKGFNEYWQKVYYYYPFNGTFDGGNFTISGLKVDANVSYAGLFGYVGPKGAVKNLTLAVGDGGSIKSTEDYVGAIAGYSEGIIEACYNSLPVFGKSNVGGLVGELRTTTDEDGEYEENGIIRYSYNTGSVVGTSSTVGGIAGRVYDGSLVTEVMNLGLVQGSSAAGGLIGYLYGDLSNSYNAGSVSLASASGYYVGGLVGQSGRSNPTAIPTIDACYNIGQVTVSNPAYSGSIGGSNSATVTNVYYDKQIVTVKPFGSNSEDEDGVINGVFTEYLTEVNVLNQLEGFSSDVWAKASNATTYPYLKNLKNDNAVKVSVSGLNLTSGENYQISSKVGSDFTVDNSSVNIAWNTESPAVLTVSGNEVIVNTDYDDKNVAGIMVCQDENGNYSKYINLNLLPYLSGGQGTETNPYLISTVDDLGELSANVADSITFEGVHLKLTANITLNSDYLHTPIGTIEDKGFDEYWQKVYYYYPFNGTFDGGNFTITGLKVDATTNYAGLFGYVGPEGVVKNLTLSVGDEGYIKSTGDYVGAIAGYSEGIVESCYNSLPVSGKAYVGGLVGEVTPAEKVTTEPPTGPASSMFRAALEDDDDDVNVNVNVNGIIRYSYNTGSVSGTGGTVGGIAGRAQANSLITESMNLGAVTTTTAVGGLVGYLYGDLSNSYNSGSVSATSSYGYVGGLVGQTGRSGSVMPSIEACYNIGQVNGLAPAYTGSIVGSNAGTVVNTYYDKQIVALKPFGSNSEDEEGVALGISSSEFMDAYVLSNEILPGITSDFWTKQANSTTYPQLKNVRDDNATKVSVSGLNLTAGENYQTSNKVKEDFMVDRSLVYITWTTDSDLLSINLGQVEIDTEYEGVNVMATMICSDTQGLYEKIVNLNLLPYLSGGQGTESEPYLISSGEDLAELSANVGVEALSFEDTYFKVSTNITLDADYIHTPIGRVDRVQNAETDWQLVETFYPFNGTFDGGNFTISGLKVDTETNYAGLFGYLGPNGVVKNLTLTVGDGGYIKSTGDYVGAIAGYSEGIIESCRNSLPIFGKTQVGGLAGEISPAEKVGVEPPTGPASSVLRAALEEDDEVEENGIVRYSYNTGAVTATGNTAGGLVGRAQANSLITESMNLGAVTSANTAGGLVGNLYGNLTNSYNSGFVTITATFGYVGGLAGQTSRAIVTDLPLIESCLSIGQISGPVLDYTGSVSGSNAGAVTNTYYDKQIIPFKPFGSNSEDEEGSALGVTTSELTSVLVVSEEGLDGITSDIWKKQYNSTTYPQLINLVDDNAAKVSVSAVNLTSEDNYQISTKVKEDFTVDRSLTYITWTTDSDLLSINLGVVEVETEYAGANAEAIMVCSDYDRAYEKIVKLNLYPYVSGGQGTAGNPYLISSVEDLQEMAETVNQGKFATNSYILTTDLDVAEVEHTAIGTEQNSFAGSFNGQAYTISELNVEADKYAGLFGYVDADGAIANLKLKNGSVTATGDYAGAVAGYNAGTVTNVFNSHVEVKAANYAGGIVGENTGEVADVMTTVVPTTEKAGVIVGKSSGTVSSVYSAFAGEYNLVGENADGTLENAYYDKQMAPASSVGTGLLTVELASEDLEGFGDAWTLTADLYPVLTSFANANEALLAISPIFLAEEEDIYSITKDFTVSIENEVSWATEDSDVLSIEDENVTVTRGESDEQVSIIATLNGLAKTINLTVKAADVSVEKETLKDVRVYGVSNAIVVELNESATVSVYTTSGSLVKQVKAEGPVATVYAEAGVYIVKLVTDNGGLTTKVVVK